MKKTTGLVHIMHIIFQQYPGTELRHFPDVPHLVKEVADTRCWPCVLSVCAHYYMGIAMLPPLLNGWIFSHLAVLRAGSAKGKVPAKPKQGLDVPSRVS
jgi:hypothetical protein